MPAASSGLGALAPMARTALRRLRDPNDVRAAVAVSVALCVGELALCSLIVWRVPYTEIDWRAYMDEVGGYLAGERDYTKLRGDTGPLVYPAGFVYLYAALRRLTGGDVASAQIIFILVYVANLAAVLAAYVRARVVPPWALVTLALSKRVHSIFVLRLFNDCFAALFAHVAVLLFQSRRWTLGAVALSLGVSVKMNVLLMLPPLLVLLVGGARVSEAITALAAALATQIALAYPFLAAYPREYLSRAFEFSRAFLHVWTVNWKFVPEDVFLSSAFARGLLFAHLVALFALAHRRWCANRGGFFPDFVVDALRRAVSDAPPSPAVVASLTPAKVATALFEGNFVGVVFARSLHYQFYAWYFHSLPMLLWSATRYPGGDVARLATMFAIERAWCAFPATPETSATLLAAHVAVLLGVWFADADARVDEGEEAVGRESEGGDVAGREGPRRSARRKRD